MNFFLDPQGFLTLDSKLVTIRQAQPVLNGVELRTRAEVLQNDPEHKKVCYRSPELGQGSFNLEARRDDDVIELRYWLEDTPPPWNSIPLDCASLPLKICGCICVTVISVGMAAFTFNPNR